VEVDLVKSLDGKVGPDAHIQTQSLTVRSATRSSSSAVIRRTMTSGDSSFMPTGSHDDIRTSE
jgi:hypothetical protein